MTSATLRQALALHQAGRLKEAEARCRQALAEQPGNPEALHLLGLMAHQSGRHEDAADLIRQAIVVRPRPAFSYNLALVHLARRDATAAEHALRQTISAAPDHAEALFHLGGLMRARQDLAGAIDCYRRAVVAKPDFVDAHVNLGLLLNEVGTEAEAVSELEVADRLRRGDARILNSLGMVRSGSAPDAAIEDFRRALAADRRFTEAAMNLAKLLASLARHAEAIEILEATLNNGGNDIDVVLVLAGICAEANRVEDAVAYYEKAAALAPRSARPLVALGNLQREIGQFERAYECHRRARELEPENGDALVGILKHLKSRAPADEIERIAALADNPSFPAPKRRQLHFALAQYHEAAGEYDVAFHRMSEGNRLRRQELEAKHGPFDPERETARISRTIEAFDADYFRRVAGFGLASELPVFIVGMPRSGTSLCEQILSSHPLVFGAGELMDISRLARKLQAGFADRALQDDDGYATLLTTDLVRSSAEQHLRRLKALSPEAERVVDKMPMNYRRLGLVATLFPRARIVHCRRDPLDVGLSCFSRDLASMPVWITDLRAIGHVHREHERLMAHWHRVLPSPIFEFSYEEVIADLAGSARRLIAFCGLEWHDSCLEFHRTDRRVRTASLEQVRRPIYHSSIGRWRWFAAHLGPLREAIGEAAQAET